MRPAARIPLDPRLPCCVESCQSPPTWKLWQAGHRIRDVLPSHWALVRLSLEAFLDPGPLVGEAVGSHHRILHQLVGQRAAEIWRVHHQAIHMSSTLHEDGSPLYLEVTSHTPHMQRATQATRSPPPSHSEWLSSPQFDHCQKPPAGFVVGMAPFCQQNMP